MKMLLIAAATAFIAVAALALGGCATTGTVAAGPAASGESETASLARQLAESRANYARLYETVRAGHPDAALATLPAPTGRAAQTQPAAQTAPPPPSPVAYDQGPGYGGGTPVMAAPLPGPTVRAPRVGAVGNVGFEGPVPDLGFVGRSLVSVALIDTPYAVEIFVDGRRICPTPNGWDYPQLATDSHGSICVSAPVPDTTRTIVLALRGQNVQHRVTLRAWGYTSSDPMGEPIGSYSEYITPARSLSRVIAVSQDYFR